jgi:hypothetical protein
MGPATLPTGWRIEGRVWLSVQLWLQHIAGTCPAVHSVGSWQPIGGQAVRQRKGTIMTKHELPGLPPDVDGARQRSATSFADANLGQLFYALLDDGDLEEVMGDFLVPAGPPASPIPPVARSAKRPGARRELTRAAAALSARRAFSTTTR